MFSPLTIDTGATMLFIKVGCHQKAPVTDGLFKLRNFIKVHRERFDTFAVKLSTFVFFNQLLPSSPINPTNRFQNNRAHSDFKGQIFLLPSPTKETVNSLHHSQF